MNQAEEIIRQGVTAMVCTVLFGILLTLTIWGHREYSTVSEWQANQTDLAQKAEAYRFETVGEVEGVDIVEFILKNDALYDYYICNTLNASALSDANAAALSASGDASKGSFIAITKARYQKNKDTSMWSSEYLIRSVFGQNLSSTYKVYTYTDNGDTYAYGFVRIN